MEISTLRHRTGSCRFSLVPAFVAAALALAVGGLSGVALAQEDPLAYRLEIYVVSHVTREDGTREERYTETSEARPGQTVEYRIFVENVSDMTLPAGVVQIRLPVPEGTEYVPNSATPSSDRVLTEFSADRGMTFSEPPVLVGDDEQRRVAEPTAYEEIRWTFFVELEPGQEETLVYRVIVR